MFDPRTTPRPKIRKRDVVVRQGTEQPRGIVVIPPFPIEDADLRGLRSAPLDPAVTRLPADHPPGVTPLPPPRDGDCKWRRIAVA
jgi:hypothetical protein